MNIDLSPVIQSVIGLCGVALTIFGGMALQAIAKRAGVQTTAQQQANFDGALGKAISFGVSQADAEIAAKGWDHPAVKNAVVATALSQMATAFPGALKDVGLSADLSDPANKATITAALQRALPAAFTAAAASPATPPAPVASVVQTTAAA